ncbi:MAG: serine/threonine protein kinase [Isosphaeraceae bacterium]
MLDPQASRFWQATVFSGLMDAEGLNACWNAIPPGKRDAPEHIDRRLARQAVQSNSLTLWQAQQLLAGRTSGFKVDRYLLLDLIGQGGMGRVYLARDTRLNRRVALKILAPERVNNPRAVARFQREARVGAQLQHENLVRIYDFGEANGRYFLVMEFIAGKTIGHLISEQGPMPMATAARLVRQVAMGLGHAHSKGLIHRDVNPYNIMVTNDGTAKLADLGLAIDLTEGDRVTREGATVGTFDYVAPEQARHSHAADIRSDIYSLGCTLYHMLTGQVPFPSPSLPEKLFAHQAMEPTPLEQLAPGLPAGFVEIVRKMMRKSPDERYATPAQLVQALEPYLDEPAGSLPRPEPARTPPGPVVEASPQPDERRGSTSAVTTAASGSRPSEDSTLVAVPRAATEPAAATLSPLAVPVGLPRALAGTAGPGPGPGSASGTDLDDPTVPLLTPIEEHADADGGTNGSFLVDLGPEPPLSERLARSRPRAPIAPPPRPVPAPIRDGAGSSSTSTSDQKVWWPPIGMFLGLVAVAMVATVLVVILGMAGGLRAFQKPSSKIEEKPSSEGADKTVPQPAISVDEPSIVVRYDHPELNGDEKGTPFKDLNEAIGYSMGLGYVELHNREPMRIEAHKFASFDSGRGRLDIRGAPGVVPVLEIEMSPGKPFLATGSSVPLSLTGLEIRVHYPNDTNPSSTTVAKPVIHATGPVHIQRCAFVVVGDPPRPDGSRAVTVEGKDLNIEGSWFQGFDKAIQINAYNGSFRIRQTMIVSGPPAAPASSTAAEWYGWGMEVHLEAGGIGHRQLVLEDCTFEGAGLLDLIPGTLPLDAVVKRCTVRARAILACPQEHLAQLRWKGEGNLLDIQEKCWIVLTSGTGTPALSTSVIDLASWTKVATSETDPIRAKLIFRTIPTSRSYPSRPGDFAIDTTDSPGTKVGADPDQVGPWAQ